MSPTPQSRWVNAAGPHTWGPRPRTPRGLLPRPRPRKPTIRSLRAGRLPAAEDGPGRNAQRFSPDRIGPEHQNRMAICNADVMGGSGNAAAIPRGCIGPRPTLDRGDHLTGGRVTSRRLGVGRKHSATRRRAMMCFMWALTAQLAARFHAVSHGHTVTATAKANGIQGMDGVAFHREGQHHPTVHAQNTPPEKRT